MKLPYGWKMLQHHNHIELTDKSGNITILVFHALPSDIRIIDKRNNLIPYEDIDTVLADAYEPIDELSKIIEDVVHKLHSRLKRKELKNKRKEVIKVANSKS